MSDIMRFSNKEDEHTREEQVTDVSGEDLTREIEGARKRLASPLLMVLMCRSYCGEVKGRV